MHRRLFIFAIWSVAAIIGCTSATSPGPKIVHDKPLATTTLFVDKDSGFRIDGPREWLNGRTATVDNSNGSSLEVPLSDNDQIVICARAIDPGTDTNPLSDDGDYLRGIMRGVDGTVVSDEKAIVDGSPARRIWVTQPPVDGAAATKGACWMAIHGNVMFCFCYTASEKNDAKYRSAVERMIGSVRWIP